MPDPSRHVEPTPAGCKARDTPGMTMDLRVRDRATAGVERAIAFFASNWILLLLGIFFSIVLIVANLGIEFWAERTFREGKLFETRIDPARIFQQVAVLLLAIPALIFAVWRSWTAGASGIGASSYRRRERKARS